VATLLAEVERVVGVGRELDAKLDEAADVHRAFVHEDAHHRFVAQPCARVKRVVDVQLRRVVTGDGRGDAALRPVVLEVELSFFVMIVTVA